MAGITSIKFPTMKPASPKMLLMIFLPAILILGAFAAISILYQVPISKFTRDPTAIAYLHPFSGALSNLGVLLWCAAGTTCAFAAFILRSAASREKFLFLVSSSLLSAYLMFDDLFRVHEDLSLRIGLNEYFVFALLGIAVLTYLIYFRKILFQTNVVMFLIAMAFLSLSVMVDLVAGQLFEGRKNLKYLIEDGSKWIGIVFWCSYYVHTSFHFTAEVMEGAGNTAKPDSPSGG